MGRVKKSALSRHPGRWWTALKNVVSQKASLAGARGRQQWRSHPMVLLGAVVGVPWESFSLWPLASSDFKLCFRESVGPPGNT